MIDPADKPDINVEWRLVSTNYLVSADGRVWSRRRAREVGGKATADGYPTAYVDGRTQSIHLLVLNAFIGPRPSTRHVARHLNDVPGDNRLVNLTWGTKAENAADAQRNGRQLGAPGVRNRAAKLDLEDVERIRYLRKRGMTTVKIAAEFDVSQSLVSAICLGKRWAA